MITRKVLLRFILASCAFHAAFLSLAGILLSGSSTLPFETFTVRLADSPVKQADDSRKAEIKKEVSLDKPRKEPAAGPEETVDLANPAGKYRTYLRDLRQKIESLWVYPREAYARSETGTAVVRFSIQSDGTLAATGIVSSSGFESLDRGALAVVQAAAPYAPFPETFNLSTLHIVARFEYELD
ncbi:MAG TPA: energy transducer TonB [Syntrophales bacterium]|nr:energy transducer TonB [Syntrophobacterales bacterium]HQL91451.1 energy transducer TonB [Syntrophales bacterium]